MSLFTVLLAACPQSATTPGAPLAEAPTLSWGDWNGDGLPDAVLLEAGTAPRLLVNVGDGPFEEHGARIGLPASGRIERALWSDFDGDGRDDLLLVSRSGASHLLRNAPGGSFEDLGAASGLPLAQPLRAARWIDLDGDGRDDLELATAEGIQLFGNRGGGSFARLDWLRGAATGVAPGPGQPVAPRAAELPASEAATETALESPSSPKSTERSGTTRRAAPANADAPITGAAAPTRTPMNPLAACVFFIKDQATAACLRASSLPTLGLLYPLSTELNVDLAGHVGMGITNNTHKLTVQGTSGNDVLRLIGTGGQYGVGAKLNFGDGDLAYVREYADDELQVYGDKVLLLSSPAGEVDVATTRFKVNALDSSSFLGKVGVGVSSPSFPLDVAAGQAVARLDSTSATNGSVLVLDNSTVGTPSFLGAINFVDNAGQTPGQIAYTGAGDMTFRTGGGQRMAIRSDGSVTLGAAPGSWKLSVLGGVFGAILGETAQSAGSGVFGRATSSSGTSNGVRGESAANDGVRGDALAQSVSGSGVIGYSWAKAGAGVSGTNNSDPGSTGLVPYGVHGSVGAATGYGVFSNGRFGATGTKAFVQPHPADASKSIRFISLEGNEAGTYCRGRGRLAGGVARIALPEEFSLATSELDLTAQATAREEGWLWVASCTREELVVRGPVDVAFDWTVNGLRRGFEDEPIVVDNSDLRPRVKGVPFLPGFSPAYRKLLLEAGITNDDGTPNEATAARLGWELLEPDDPRAERYLSAAAGPAPRAPGAESSVPAPVEPALAKAPPGDSERRPAPRAPKSVPIRP